MERVILASHGSLASGMRSALKMIACDVDDIQAYDLDVYNNPKEIHDAIEKEINSNPDDIFIIVTDLLGGSVHIQLLDLCANKNVHIVSGMNLGLVLEIYLTRTDDVVGKIEHALSSSKEAMKIFNAVSISQYLESDEEGL